MRSIIGTAPRDYRPALVAYSREVRAMARASLFFVHRVQ